MSQSLPTFTPFFDWVLRATGDSSTTLAYGVIWRYAQMGAQKRGGCCYAACERLAGELGWTRQRLMRHLRRLLDLSLITYNNPTALGVPREYIPVAQEGARPPPPKGPAQTLSEEREPRPGPLGGCHTAPAPPKGPAQTLSEERYPRPGPLC
jgi:hypothetical protein